MEKVVFITGASRGIGAATAKLFAKNHYHIALNYLKETKKAEDLKEKLEKEYQVKVLLVQGDISKEEEVKKMVEKINATFCKIDVLINNAAISCDQELEEKTSEDFMHILRVNLLGAFLVTKYVGLEMQKNGSGKIIFVSSTNGIDTYYPLSIDYDASKAGVISLMHNFATLFAPYIKVNTVAPGWTKTDATKDLSFEFEKEELKKILLNRFASPEEIASVIYFLTTEDASYINDTVIRVDGGVKH